MVPVLLGSHRKFFPSLDEENTGIADLSRSGFTQPAKQSQFVRRHTEKPLKATRCAVEAAAQLFKPRSLRCVLPKTAPEVLLIALAVRETRAGRLCTADAAAIQTPVHFWLVKAEHLRAEMNI